MGESVKMKKQLSLLVGVVVLSTFFACSKSNEFSGVPIVPNSVTGEVLTSLAEGEAETVKLSNDAETVVRNIGGIQYLEIEATFSNRNFSATLANSSRLKQEINKALSKLKASRETSRIIPLSEVSEVGYFTFLLPYNPHDLFSSIKKIRFEGQELLFNPVVYDRRSIKLVNEAYRDAEALFDGARGTTDHYSGLKRINAVEFVRQAQEDIGEGVSVDGSSVNLGITDTGITYNHPTFLDSKNANRISYMKDFTGEGRIYFNPSAKFEIVAVTHEDDGGEKLLLNAEVIVTPKLPSRPAADRFVILSNLEIKVSTELKNLLLSSGRKVKLGILSESAFSAEGEEVDINRNGKIEDQLPVIYIMGATPVEDILYFDSQGAGDFRKSVPIGNWNTTNKTVTVYSEKIGFDFNVESLPKKQGSGAVEVRSVSVVGFDPGNHGSHVAGIAAGRKTISNDSDDTLARGVAPAANILMNRVCANNGGCNATAAFIDLALKGKAEVINMSLGGLNQFNDGYGVQETMINRLTILANTLFVISAGNSGPGRQTVGSPSVARFSLSVGASASKDMIQRQYGWPADTDSDRDFMLFFSSRGPTAAGGFKPNLVAPGTELSAIQLNSAPGHHAGSDVYWGTSMAAPTAAGAYALLLDGVKKYNAKHPESALTADALTLRSVLIETAKPFNVTTFDPNTGEKRSGEYTWVDQGTGIIDLVAAWKKLFELRDIDLPSAVTLSDGRNVELDYEPLVSTTNPNGISYDGSRPGIEGTPVFGTGIYLDFYGTETLRQVNIVRKISEKYIATPEAGDLNRQLQTSSDEFVLKTVIFGSDKIWLKAGTLDQVDCWNSPVSTQRVTSSGAEVKVKENNTGEIVARADSTLNICLNRRVIARELPPGDNGALIYAYRTIKKGNDRITSPVAAFVVPVFIAVPHKRLFGSTAYEAEGTVKSFGISRNYVTIPKGTGLVRVTLEVPALKIDPEGFVSEGEDCSGLELMALEGKNDVRPFRSRKDARVFNCNPDGSPVAKEGLNKVVFTRSDPNAGVWDLHVFGSYKYARSKYKLRVDYLTAISDVQEISGDLSALNGSFSWKLKESSMSIMPDSEKSSYSLYGMLAQKESQVAKGEHVFVTNPLGIMRSYPENTKMVVVTTEKSPGNDIDLTVLECPVDAEKPDDNRCGAIAASGGPADDEMVRFRPNDRKKYVVRVDGYDVKDDGGFTSVETIYLPEELGQISITELNDGFIVNRSITDEQVSVSKFFTSDLFTSGKYKVTGDLTIRSTDDVVLSVTPVRISKQ